jgi:hypothetical protein
MMNNLFINFDTTDELRPLNVAVPVLLKLNEVRHTLWCGTKLTFT